ncbi:MAG: hypothetical protein GY809_10920 [Planctomycetes bacterium]|nr:hypothetical protein [Planctomycetota bacterium]
MTGFYRLCLVVIVLGLYVPAGGQSRLFKQGRQVGQIKSKLLDEISGLAASRKNPGVLWVHNDSGDRAQIYAIDVRGRLLSTFLVTGALARDWEDIAVGPGPEANVSYLYIADIGNNRGKRPVITVYRVPEPSVSLTEPVPITRTAKVDVITLTYPDQPRDAETLFVDPLTRDIYIISKREMSNRLYCVPYPQSGEGETKMQLKATLGIGYAVGGDMSSDGRFAVVRSAFGAVMYERAAKKAVWEAFKQKPVAIPVKSEPQGEAIAFDVEGRGYYTISEGKKQPIYYYERIKATD